MRKYKFLSVFIHLSPSEREAFVRFISSNHERKTNAVLVCEALCKHRTNKLVAAQSNLGALEIPETIFMDKKGVPKDKEKIHRDILNIFSELFPDLKQFVLGYDKDMSDWATQFRWVTFLDDCGEKKEANKELEVLYGEITGGDHVIQSMRDVQITLAVAQKYRDFLFSSPQDHSVLKVKSCLNFINNLINTLKWKAEIESANLLKLVNNTPIPTSETESLLPDSESSFQLNELYREIHGMLFKKDLNCYKRAKELFKKHVDKLDREEMQIAFRYLVNSGTELSRKAKIPESKIARDLFELYYEAEKNNLLSQEGVFETGLLFNIINAAAQSHQFEWANNFFDKYAPHLYTGDELERMNQLKNAVLAFEQKDFDNVLKAIKSTQYTFDYDIIRAKVLLICTSYEIKDKELLREQQRSLGRHFKNRVQSPAYIGTNNLAQIVHMMLVYQMPKADILKALETLKPYHKEEWVAQKLQRYKGKGD
jgi:hypothetical protein